MRVPTDWKELKKVLPTGSAAIGRYRDKQFRGNRIDYYKRLMNTTTLYIGNLSFYTTEEQIYEIFSKCGGVRRVIMGLDRYKKTPCGFCFVEFYSRQGCEGALRYINGLRLDDRVIRTDWDAGFEEGRQFGRGRSGGQVRDEVRNDFDSGRGGWGKLIQQRLESDEKTGGGDSGATGQTNMD